MRLSQGTGYPRTYTPGSHRVLTCSRRSLSGQGQSHCGSVLLTCKGLWHELQAKMLSGNKVSRPGGRIASRRLCGVHRLEESRATGAWTLGVPATLIFCEPITYCTSSPARPHRLRNNECTSQCGSIKIAESRTYGPHPGRLLSLPYQTCIALARLALRSHHSLL